MAANRSNDLNPVLAILERHTAVDFKLYKPATLRRRTARRMAALKLKTLPAYAAYLRSHPAEVQALFEDLLIQVTDFFRDPAIFRYLKKNFLAPLFRRQQNRGPIRVWVPACSSGEEVYSLAIILAELAEREKDGGPPIQVFGSDVNETVLAKARAGIYAPGLEKRISAERLRKFFEPAPGGFRVRKSIRDLCIFARHDLASDPPFSNLHLISCRNVLIYFGPALQQRLMPLFHFALKPAGGLLLGSSETVGTFGHLFSPRDQAARFYQKKAAGANGSPPRLSRRPSGPRPGGARASASQLSGNLPIAELRAMAEGEVGPAPAAAPAARTENRLLRRELAAIRGSLPNVIEQLEATNEELRAANEEIVSSNEEMQSTNEELETAKEELQSANEELATVNGELAQRNSELEKANLIASRFQAIVTSSDDAIISKDLNGIIHTWNQGAERIFGYTAEEAVGQPVSMLIPADRPNEEPQILARLRRGEKIDHYETIRRRKDGQLINISLTVSPVRAPSGEIVGASKIARDITAKIRAEADLWSAREDAEKASRAKDHFLASLSHELRAPLSPVLLLASDAAANSSLTAEVRDDFEMIRRNVELEARIIDDLLDLTRINVGKLRMDLQRVDAFAVLASVIALLRPEIERKKLTLIEHRPPGGAIVRGDSVRLHQVFWNVLNNAAKFTPAGGTVRIDASVSGGQAAVVIADSGIGMTPAELDLAFNAFAQGSHADDAPRAFGGLGLGLAITKKLVEEHSGRIAAASEGRNRGATFTLAFPLDESEKSTPVPLPSAPEGADADAPASARILLVEDHEATRETLSRLLKARGYAVAAAGSIESARSLALQGNFDIVVSDIGLPDGDGHALFAELRKRFPGIKGIALTGYGQEEDQARTKAQGFDQHLTKPVQIRALEKALELVLGR